MLHTGDTYETRARAARNRELRSLTRALTGFLFGRNGPQSRNRATAFTDLNCANDVIERSNRAA